jgi:hypothetical protein
MANADQRAVQTPEEVLEEEIEDLERPVLRTWLPWAFGTVALLVLFGAVWSVVFWEHGAINDRFRAAAAAKSEVSLLAPRGVLEGSPEVLRWVEVPGATSYVVSVRKVDGEPILIRPAAGAHLVTTDIERAYLLPGDYRWRVEARDSRGSSMAMGETTFKVTPDWTERRAEAPGPTPPDRRP